MLSRLLIISYIVICNFIIIAVVLAASNVKKAVKSALGNPEIQSSWVLSGGTSTENFSTTVKKILSLQIDVSKPLNGKRNNINRWLVFVVGIVHLCPCNDFLMLWRVGNCLLLLLLLCGCVYFYACCLCSVYSKSFCC